MALNYIEHLLILGSVVIGCVSMSAFASFANIPIGISSSAVRLTTFAITPGIKKYKTTIKKIKKKHSKMVVLVKTKLKSTEVISSSILIDSYISQGVI